MSQQLKIAIAVVLLGMGYSAYDFYIFHSEEVVAMNDSLTAQEGSLAQKQRELQKLQNFAQNIETIKQELRELNFQLESALEYMPRTHNLSSLLRKLTMLAQNSGLDLFNFKPSEQEERKDGEFYSTIPVELNLKGSFTQTLVFLDQVARLKRIIASEKIEMKMADSSNVGSTNLDSVATIRIYRFTE